MKMKKLAFLPLAMLGVLAFASCSQDDEPIAAGNDGNVNLTVSLPQDMATRQFSSGRNATQLQYAVYEAGSTTPLPVIKQADGETLGTVGTATFVDLKATVSLTLARSKDYNIVFWAQDPTVKAYTFDAAKQTVTTNFNGVPVNDDIYDAFTTNYRTGIVTGPINRTITLYRPFAQINVGTNDVAEAAAAGLTVNTVDITVPSYNTLNLVSGEVGVDGNFDQTATVPTAVYTAAAPATAETFPVDGYTYLSMNYLLVPKDKSSVNVRFYVNAQPTGSTLTDPSAMGVYENVPVQRNYRTNIYGALLTDPAVFNVQIDPAFNVPDNDYDIKGWDGTVSDKLDKDTDGKTVLLNAPQDLALFARMMEAGTLDPSTPVKLNADMDLNSIEWKPIKNYAGTFDAQGHTIKNLSMTTSAPFMGLFDRLKGNATIKNLTIENVNIVNTTTDSDTGTGAIAGDPFTSSIQNATVKGNIYITAYRYVGAIAGHNAYGTYTGLTVDANPGSYVRSTSTSQGLLSAPAQCGGVIGYCGEGGTVFKDITSNINVIADSYGAGGIFGTLQSGNQVTGCSSSGTVTLTKPMNAKYAQAIGGIAGDYIPGSRIDVNGCTFTGTLSSNVNGTPFTDFLNGGLVGISYGGRSAGVGVNATDLYIDGVQKPYPAN